LWWSGGSEGEEYGDARSRAAQALVAGVGCDMSETDVVAAALAELEAAFERLREALWKAIREFLIFYAGSHALVSSRG